MNLFKNYIFIKVLIVIFNWESVWVIVFVYGFRNIFVFLDIFLMVFEIKIDKVCSEVDRDVEEVFYSEIVKLFVDKVVDVIVILWSYVFLIKNYEKEGFF